ncbi:MAG: hypothetical protein ABL865_00415 [Candidatus Nitrotoga sp.]
MITPPQLINSVGQFENGQNYEPKRIKEAQVLELLKQLKTSQPEAFRALQQAKIVQPYFIPVCVRKENKTARMR